MADRMEVRSAGNYGPLMAVCIAALVLYAGLAVYQYLHLVYSDWDMAAYNQFFWGLRHGKLYSSLYGFHCWGEHAGFFDVWVALSLAVFPHPLTFAFWQIVLFVLSSVVLYCIAAEDLGPRVALTLTLLYLFFPANLLAMLNDPNPEAFSPFFILLAVFLYRKKRLAAYFVVLLLLMSIKENMALIIIMLGGWGLFAQDRERVWWGAIPLGVAVVYFIFVTTWLIPHLRGVEQHPLWLGRYGYLGSSFSEGLLNLLRGEAWRGLITNPSNIVFICSLFGILLVPALLSPSMLLLAVPIIAQHLLSNYPSEKSIGYFYSLTMTPVVFLATVNSLKKGILGIPVKMICIILVGGSLLQMYGQRVAIASRVGLDSRGDVVAMWRMVQKIPPDAGVVATFRFLPALSFREHLYSLHKVIAQPGVGERLMRDRYFDSKEVAALPADRWYALVDFNDTWIRQELQQGPDSGRKVVSFLRDWREIDSCGSVKLYQRGAEGGWGRRSGLNAAVGP